jgi:hypothetical protein
MAEPVVEIIQAPLRAFAWFHWLKATLNLIEEHVLKKLLGK